MNPYEMASRIDQALWHLAQMDELNARSSEALLKPVLDALRQRPVPPASPSPAPHDSQCETELTSHGYTPCRCVERANPAIRLAREAANGWACYAKRKIELDEIGRIHKALDDLRTVQPPSGAGTWQRPTCATCRSWVEHGNMFDRPLGYGQCHRGVRQGGSVTGGIYTERGFGCTLHEPAAPTSPPQETT